MSSLIKAENKTPVATTTNPSPTSHLSQFSSSEKQRMSITETSNPLTKALDSSTGEDVVRILRTSDAQMFAGYDVFPSFADEHIQSSLDRGSDVVANVLHDPNGIVVISGSGTSGRLAFMIATLLNATIRKTTRRTGPGPFFYCNSGGDSALLLPSELAEDNTKAGVSDLLEVIRRGKVPSNGPVMVIGVTCGMSAPYVAGQLDYALNAIARKDTNVADFSACLIGFNPTSLARNIPIEMWCERPENAPHTFRDIAFALESGVARDKEQESGGGGETAAAAGGGGGGGGGGGVPKHVLINPVVGPESLTGSTRMKGGSATKICLETMLSLGLCKSGVLKREDMSVAMRYGGSDSLLPQSSDILGGFYSSFVAAYSSTERLGKAVELVGKCLRNQGKVYYLGSNVASIIGFIDASEMRPTFGAPASETRAFASAGWVSLGNDEGDQTQRGPLYRINFQNFRMDVLPQLTKSDIVIALHLESCEEKEEASAVDELALISVAKSGCQSVRLSVGRRQQQQGQGGAMRETQKQQEEEEAESVDFGVHVNLHSHDGAADMDLLPSYDAFGALTLKIALNALSTGGQALAGRVLSNRMINVTPSNHKLFLRCTGLITLLASRSRQVVGGTVVDENYAKKCLLRAIYNIDDDEEKLMELCLQPVSDHIKSAGAMGSIKSSNKLLPIAILLACGKCDTVITAKEMLNQHATVRGALSAV